MKRSKEQHKNKSKGRKIGFRTSHYQKFVNTFPNKKFAKSEAHSNQSGQSGNKTTSFPENKTTPSTIKCWVCQGPHLQRDFPKKTKGLE